MRIAFFGGTFDPPHRGHFAIAQAAADRLRLDRVLFAPVGNQPLKHDSSVAGFEDRTAMVKLTIAGDARFELSFIDAPRPDNQPNYTIDTVCSLNDSLRPEDQLFCLVGADSFLSLPHWYRAAELLFACDFIVAGRPGFDIHNVGKSLPQGMRISGEAKHEPGLSELNLTNDAGQSTTLHFLPDLREEISATELRTALSEHLIPNDTLPEPVAEYIRAHHLYQ
jgi:nicotinate-nucleotide adenylyltransferase